ncbi:PfkB family carbohydrate kinase [Nostocoides australiense]
MAPRLLCLGDNVVDRYVDTGVMYPGGNALNVAVHARRLGTDAAYLGVTGDDAAGDLVRSALISERVDVARVKTRPGMTAYADVRLIEGNRVFGHGDPGVSRFVLGPDELADVGAFDLVHTGECSGVEDQLPAIAQAAARLSFDFSERPWEYIAQFAPIADIAIASLPSGEHGTAVDYGLRIAALGPRIVVVTGGPQGAWLISDGQVAHAAAGTGPIVDTLGAGDAFIARFLTGLLREEPSAHALAAATAYATDACATFGAFGHPGAPIETPASGVEHPAWAQQQPRN